MKNSIILTILLTLISPLQAIEIENQLPKTVLFKLYIKKDNEILFGDKDDNFITILASQRTTVSYDPAFKEARQYMIRFFIETLTVEVNARVLEENQELEEKVFHCIFSIDKNLLPQDMDKRIFIINEGISERKDENCGK